MKEGIHPSYREVCFVDLSNGFKFVTRSCAQTRETIKMDDGRELPLFKLDTTSESHPVLHRHAEERRFAGRPRREVPQQVRQPRRQEVAPAPTQPRQGSLGCLFSCRGRARRAAASCALASA